MSEWDEGATQIKPFVFADSERVLIADGDARRRGWLVSALQPGIDVEEVEDARSALERLTANPPRVLIVGPELIDISGSVLLGHAVRYGLVGGHHSPVVFLIGNTVEQMANVDEHQIPVFYRITPALQRERVRDLVELAFQRHDAPAPRQREDPARTAQLLEFTKRFGLAQDLKAAASTAEAAVITVVGAERARILYYDDDSGSLWSETQDGSDETQASAGVAGLAVRTGMAMVLQVAAQDPAYRPFVDDPAGTGHERLAVQPVRDREGRVHAVLIAIRLPTHPPFSQIDVRMLQGVAESWSPFLHQLALVNEAQAAEEVRRESSIYRAEAVSHMMRRGNDGDVVRVHPGWVSAAYWVVVASLIAAGVFGFYARIHQYTSGSGVVRITGRGDVVAFDGGTVTGVEVAVGQQVTNGQVLVRLHDTDQAARLRGLDADFDRALVAYLLDPSEAATRQQLGSVVSSRQAALASVDARVIRANFDGVVKDVMVRSGQRIDAGKVVMSIARSDVSEGISVLAFLPGADRPRLRPKQTLRLTLPGYRNARIQTEVYAISAEVLGAAEANSRFLGQRLADIMQLQGSVVVVEARLPSPEFEADGERFTLHDGMVGFAEVQLDSRTILESVVPGFER